MKKVGKVVLWAVAVLVVIEIVGAVVVRSSRRIRPHTVLTLRIEGDVPEQPPLDPLAQPALVVRARRKPEHLEMRPIMQFDQFGGKRGHRVLPEITR